MILPIICVVLAIIIVTIMFTAGGIAGIAMGAGQQALGLVIIGIIIYVVALAYAVTICYTLKNINCRKIIKGENHE